jgi:hypothetical protein
VVLELRMVERVEEETVKETVKEEWMVLKRNNPSRRPALSY